MSKSLAVPFSKSRRLHSVVVSGVLGLIGGGVLLFGEGHIEDYQMVGLFCWGLLVVNLFFSQKFWKKGVALTVDQKGMWYCDWDLPTVPWRYISTVCSSGSRIRPMLKVDLLEKEAFFASLDNEIREKLRGNVLVKPDCLFIPVGNLETPTPEITSFIRNSMG